MMCRFRHVMAFIMGTGEICGFGVAFNPGLRTFGLGLGTALGYACSLGVATMLIFLMRHAR